MAPSAQIITAEVIDIQDPDIPFFYHIVRVVIEFLDKIPILQWITYVVHVVGDFFSGIWHSIVDFLRASLHQLTSILAKFGRYILAILLWVGGLLLTAVLWLLKWAAIVLVSSIILLLALDAAIKYFSREEPRDQQTTLLASDWQSSNYHTFAHGTSGATSLPKKPKWFKPNRTEPNGPATSSTNTQPSGAGAGHRHPNNSGHGSNRQASDDAGREGPRAQDKAAREEEERRRKEEQRQRKEEDRRRREEVAQDAARRKKLGAEALSRAFAAWVRMITDLTTEDMTRMGRIPNPPDVPLRCGEACREARANLGVAFCKHSMGILVENYTMTNSIKREEFVRKLVRAVHPDNQKFVRSDARVREQAAEMTKILNGLL
ncbi:hypothetical protein VPNG_04997 [Cytospora leucostoma]|uniref:Uncharacterized protein n=1 Tax=Cytospora leucostoma TaxID=1230097 RepID=A0A423X7S4_9PEZI|nr:hypothetical protein VPNG_04997 [Cytospora leucostoma]